MKLLEDSAGPISGEQTPQPRPRPTPRPIRGVLARHDLLRRALDAMSEFVFVLDEDRQVLFCNRAVLDRERLCEEKASNGGLRMGDLLKCVYALGSKADCGSADACRQCGIHRALNVCSWGRHKECECRMLTTREERLGALDLRVDAAPFELDGRRLTLLTAIDIGPDKRRQALERLFFHDVLNSVTSVYGLCCLLKFQNGPPRDELIEDILVAAQKLVAEIRSQQTLRAAEAGDLEPDLCVIGSLAFLHKASQPFCTTAAAEGRVMQVHDAAADVELETDPVLLGRVLGNMLKNALEASEWGGTISAGCDLVEGAVRFWVHNPGFMAPEVQVQIFHRSFSTKGADRGLGTYSIRLLTENYLGGKVSFSSHPEEGTTFTVCLPLKQGVPCPEACQCGVLQIPGHQADAAPGEAEGV